MLGRRIGPIAQGSTIIITDSAQIKFAEVTFNFSIKNSGPIN